MEKISVVVPVYNVEEFLESCIKSILAQTYKNLEILLLDDGSTDSSGKVCDEYAKKDNRIKVIHKKNEGISATRNLGIKISTGEYLVFIDSDDYITKDFCEILYNNLKNTNSDISIVSYCVVDENKKVIYDAAKKTGLQDDQIVIYKSSAIIKELLKQKTIKNFVWNKLFRKSVICKFDVGKIYEDISFSIDVFSKASKVVYQNTNCYNYAKRNSSITATITENNLKQFSNAIGQRYKKINEYYPKLSKYNIYALLESTLALSTKNAMLNRKYKKIERDCIKFINIILNYVKINGNNVLHLLDDYQKLCIYLMRYNIDLYFSFLKEQQTLKLLGQLN